MDPLMFGNDTANKRRKQIPRGERCLEKLTADPHLEFCAVRFTQDDIVRVGLLTQDDIVRVGLLTQDDSRRFLGDSRPPAANAGCRTRAALRL